MKMKAHGYVWVQVYKDTTPFDDGGDDNLLDVQVMGCNLYFIF